MMVAREKQHSLLHDCLAAANTLINQSIAFISGFEAHTKLKQQEKN